MSWVVSQFAPLLVVAGVFAACGVLAVVIALVFFRPVKSLGWSEKPAWVTCPHCAGGDQYYDGGWGPERGVLGTARPCPHCTGLGGHWVAGERK